MSVLCLLLISASLVRCSGLSQKCAESNQDLIKLWYKSPVDIWEEALSVGNGRLGAMVYGNLYQEIIQLNENTIYARQPSRNENLLAKEVLPEVQELIFEGKQIGGNFGCTAGVAEMLMQSHDGAVHLLPALPNSWEQVGVTRLKARGGFEVDIEWDEGVLTAVQIKSSLGGICRIRSHVPLLGKRLAEAVGENTNPFYQVPSIKSPLTQVDQTLEYPILKQPYLYDVSIEKGETIELEKLEL